MRLLALTAASMLAGCINHVETPVPIADDTAVLVWSTPVEKGVDLAADMSPDAEDALGRIVFRGGAEELVTWEFPPERVERFFDASKVELVGSDAEGCRCRQPPLSDFLYARPGEVCLVPPLAPRSVHAFDGAKWDSEASVAPELERAVFEPGETECAPYQSDDELFTGPERTLEFTPVDTGTITFSAIREQDGYILAASRDGVFLWDPSEPVGAVRSWSEPLDAAGFIVGVDARGAAFEPRFTLVTEEHTTAIQCETRCGLVAATRRSTALGTLPIFSDVRAEASEAGAFWNSDPNFAESAWETARLETDPYSGESRPDEGWRSFGADDSSPEPATWIVSSSQWFARLGSDAGTIFAPSLAQLADPRADSTARALWVEQTDRVVVALQNDVFELDVWELVQFPMEPEPGCARAPFCYRPVPRVPALNCGAEVIGLAGPLDQLTVFFADGQMRRVRADACEQTSAADIRSVVATHDGRRIVLLTESGELHAVSL